jgi:hypothetical protein
MSSRRSKYPEVRPALIGSARRSGVYLKLTGEHLRRNGRCQTAGNGQLLRVDKRERQGRSRREPLGRSKSRPVVPVRTERDKAAGLLAPVATQDLLHRALQVIVANDPEDAIEVAKRQLVSLQKRLLRGMRVGPVPYLR